LIAFSGWGLLSLLHPHLPTAPLTSFATVLFLSLFLFMVLGLVERLLGHLPLDQELEADAFVVDSGAGKDLLTALGKIFACSTFTAETIIHLPPQSQQRVKILLEQQGDTSQKNP
jgi:hypothetical protein